MSDIVLVAETGSDIPLALAEKYGIQLVPMHVSMGNKTYDDGTFPLQMLCDYHKETGKIPKTSGCSPDDYYKVFNKIHKNSPEKQILHLAYSAVTTCSFQSALSAAENLDFVTSIDTKNVSVGQGSIVIALAQFLEDNPSISLNQAIIAAEDFCSRARISFIPEDLDYLKSGGRISNSMFLGGRILQIRPQIEIENGYLVSTKKYRGNMKKVSKQLIKDYSVNAHLKKDNLRLLFSIGLADEVRSAAEAEAIECGFKNIEWLQTGCVITSHCGPKAFGLSGFAEK